jgi:hypothetical protein
VNQGDFTMFHFSWQRGAYQPCSSSQHWARKQAHASSYRPQIELLEDRVVLSTIRWINSANGNWEDASNWSGGVVPGSGDDVIIDVPGKITVRHGTGNDSIQSLISQQNLTIIGQSSLTVIEAFSESGARFLNADLASAFTASGPSAIDGASLYASNGSTITLPGATSYDALGADFNVMVRANGAGSRIDLSHVTLWQGAGGVSNGNHILVQAIQGGTVDLSQLAQVDAGNTYFQAQDGGQINLTALTSLSGAAVGDSNALEAQGGGAAIEAPNLTSLTNINLTLGGNALLPVAALTRFVNGSLFAGTDNGIGGMLALPLTTIDYLDSNILPTFQASGSGSRLDLSHVTMWRGSGDVNNGNFIKVQATGGAVVDLVASGPDRRREHLLPGAVWWANKLDCADQF